MENLIDTVLNVFVFAFVGVMVWLYFKEIPENDGSERQSNEK
ncbi:MAG: hypothetical protein WBM78_04555 [Desulfobacterales bacterium]